ncbi:MAG: hypothetical protein JRI52_03200 [Deltaproteobacteria bacterium]|nr:hypothetical protein [Deltaproteobacteria bacterium]
MSPKKEMMITPEKCVGCLNCQLICSFTFARRFNPVKAHIVVNPITGSEKAIHEVHLTDDCNRCGICVRYCVYGALTFVDEE